MVEVRGYWRKIRRNKPISFIFEEQRQMWVGDAPSGDEGDEDKQPISNDVDFQAELAAFSEQEHLMQEEVIRKLDRPATVSITFQRGSFIVTCNLRCRHSHLHLGRRSYRGRSPSNLEELITKS